MSAITGSSYIIEDTGIPKIVLTTRDSDLVRKIRYFPYTPYFFISDPHILHDKELMAENNIRITKFETGFSSVDGKKLTKVYTVDTKSVAEVNTMMRAEKKYDMMYESNIQFDQRFKIDMKLKTGIDDAGNPVDVEPRFKKVFIDIEVCYDADPDPNKHKVIVIGLYDPYDKKYHSFFIGKNEPLDLDILLSNPRLVVSHPCFSEEDMLSEFAQLWLQISPDAVVSFSPFDMRYLIDRMVKLHVDYKFLSPVLKVDIQKNFFDIACIHVIDYAELYRKVFGEPVWNTLDFIANKHLGYGKVEVKSIEEGWNNNYIDIVNYNLRDVELLKDLEEKLKLLDVYLYYIWSQTGLNLDECLVPNKVGDILHLRFINGKYIFPSTSFRTGREFEGALVILDKPGLYHNVGILDWNELYPSLMETFHISIDSFDPYGDIKLKEGIGFTSRRIGWTNEITGPFRHYRAEIKRKSKEEGLSEDERTRYSMLSAAIKVIVNAEYGLYGQKTKHFTSRFYDPRIAGSITYLGREMLIQAKSYLDTHSYSLLYADTDSLFIQLKTESPDELVGLRVGIEDFIRSHILSKYGIESKLRLDYEYTFRSVLILAKKKYDGITSTGRRIVKGLNIIQKNTAKITVEEQQKVGQMRMDGTPIPEVRKYISTVVHRIVTGEVPVEDMLVKGRCGKTEYEHLNRNLRAVEYASTLGIKLKPGERFYWLYIFPRASMAFTSGEKEKIFPCDVVAFKSLSQLPGDIVVDLGRMADYTIIKPLKRYVEEQTVEVVEQKTKDSIAKHIKYASLDSFMGA